MTRYYKTIDGDYLSYIGTGKTGGIEIKEEEYNSIMAVIKSAPEGYYRLKTDLTWEEYTPSEDEAAAISTESDEVTDEEFAAAIREVLES